MKNRKKENRHWPDKNIIDLKEEKKQKKKKGKRRKEKKKKKRDVTMYLEEKII